MGSKLSIDKHVSTLEDILAMDPAQFANLKIENTIPECITQNIKIWRYYEDDIKSKSIKSAPVSIQDILDANFTFVSNECYVVLFVYRKQAEETSPFMAFPPSMWGLVESYTNLTPRGLETPVASSEPMSNLNKEVLESFLLPKQQPQKQEGNKFEHMLFVWNGKTANPLMKAMALSKALEFDTMISKCKGPILQAMFSGGYIRNKKFYMGKVLQLDSSVSHQSNTDVEKRLDPMKETIYLMKFLFPGCDARSFKPTGFKERFLKPRKSEVRPEDEYVMMGDFDDESELIEESTPIDSPASFGKMGMEYDDFSPLESARRDVGVPAAIPKLTLSITKTQNYDENKSQNAMGSIGNAAASFRMDLKMKKPVPNLRLNRLDNETVNVEIEVEPPNIPEDAANASLSLEKSEEERQPASSDRTSESQDSRRRSERRKNANNTNRVQITNLPKVNITPIKPQVAVTNVEKLRKQFTGENEDGRESDIRRCKKEYYSEQCSEVIEGFLYVAGQTIAYNNKKLMEYGITHIINAAGDVCENPFSDRITYLTYYIKDAPVENIECVFYDAFAFIENARQQGGKVLVHCVQGVSRSVALCMAYLILKHEYTYQKAFEHIRNVRGIASPNPAFWAQLHNFHNRLFGPYDSIPSPRVFCIGSYQRETPQILVARLLPESASLFNGKYSKLLDPRAVLILQSQDKLYLWVGSEILPANKERYLAKAESYIKLLQQFEHANQECIVVHCGEEPQSFWSLWEREPQVKHGKNEEWNYWFVDLASHKNVEGTTIYEQEEEEDEMIEENRPKLYCYPRLEPLKSADMDELSDVENLLVLCIDKDNDKIVHVWRGAGVPSEVEEQPYIGDVISKKWPDTDLSEIKIFNEVPNQESETFMDYFQ